MKKVWIDIDTKEPDIGQRCLVKYKDGIVDATYIGEKEFESYIWQTKIFYGVYWLDFNKFESLFKPKK